MANLVLTGSPVATGSTFTVTQFPASPYIGEATGFAIAGNGGFTTADDLDTHANIDILTDFGDLASTYERSINGSNSAKDMRGRVVGHAWTTAGSKTVTISGLRRSVATRQQTTPVTVIDPDAETWDKVYYVDFNGSSAGMPAEDGTVVHILSYAEYFSDIIGSAAQAGQKIRIRFRADTTHEWNNTTGTSWRKYAGVIYIDRFGTGSNPLIQATGTFGSRTSFLWTIGGAGRVIVNGIDFDGGYNAVSGQWSGCFFSIVRNDQATASVSFFRCNMRGFDKMEPVRADSAFFGLIDCDVSDWHDYGVLGAVEFAVVAGCSIQQNALVGIGADGGKVTTNPAYPDHGPLRFGSWRHLCITQNVLASTNGWSGLGGQDYDQQVAIRALNEDINAIYSDALLSVFGNECYAKQLIYFGTSNGTQVATTLHWMVVEGNRIYGTRFSSISEDAALVAASEFGGVICQNNVAYAPDLRNAWGNLIATCFSTRDKGNVSTASYERPSLFRCNTVLMEYVPSADYAANTIGSLPAPAIVRDTAAAGAVVTASDNVFSAPSYTGGGSFYAASVFSRGDGLRTITGSAADANCAATPPVRDFTGELRSATSKIGAYDTTGTSVAATAPANTVAPTISIVAGAVTQAQLTGIGTWSNFIQTMIQYEWELDGTPTPDLGGSNSELFRRPFFPSGGYTGSLVAKITATNESGTKVTATSNTLTLV